MLTVTQLGSHPTKARTGLLPSPWPSRKTQGRNHSDKNSDTINRNNESRGGSCYQGLFLGAGLSFCVLS